MKIPIFFLLFSVFCFQKVKSQVVVTEDVHFDYYQNSTDNDFVNHFSYGSGLTQVLTNGITGGSLQTPDSVNWGTDNALYCSRYHPLAGDTTVTSICFQYDSTNIHPASYQRGITLWLVPYSDFNHYITASVTYNKKIELLTYSWNNNPYPNLALLHHHWYRFKLTTAFLGGATNQVFIKGEVFDLGTTGMSIPVSINSSSGSINDNVLMTDTSILVSTTGTRYGGVSYLDDFHFQGREGYSDCINTTLAVQNSLPTSSLNIYPSPATGSIYIRRTGSEEMNIRIYDLFGTKYHDIKTTEMNTQLDVYRLVEGIYIVQCTTSNRLITGKIEIRR